MVEARAGSDPSPLLLRNSLPGNGGSAIALTRSPSVRATQAVNEFRVDAIALVPRWTAGSQSVDEYPARVPPKFRAALHSLRHTIRAAAPDAEELISSQIPAFRQNGMRV
ncbi:MAG: hypothetical protein WAN74_03490 [Thermoplasmata archaeon]